MPQLHLIISGGIVVFLTFFSTCQEKIPTLPNAAPLADYDTLVVPADYIQTRNLITPGRLGGHAYLYVGANDWVTAYALLRFADLGILPDTLDSLLSCTLCLYSSVSLMADSNHTADPQIELSWLKSNCAQNWTEDSVAATNFDLSQFQVEQLTTFQFTSTDTFFLDLTDRALELLTAWRDTNQVNYGLLLKSISAAPTGITCFYSRNASYVPYLSIVTIENGDTLTRKVSCDGDAPLLYFNSGKWNSSTRLLLSAGLSSYLFVKVNLDQFNLDPNWVVGDAVLKFTLDPSLSIDYGKSATIYLTMLDSTHWDTTDYSAPTTYEVAHSLSASSSRLTLNFPGTIQNLTSGVSKNFGFVIWVATGSYSPNLYSFYPVDAASEFQPYLKIFLLKEQ